MSIDASHAGKNAVYCCRRYPPVKSRTGGYTPKEPLEAFNETSMMATIECTVYDDHSIMAMVEAGLGVNILVELVLRRVSYGLETRPTEPALIRMIARAIKMGISSFAGHTLYRMYKR